MKLETVATNVLSGYENGIRCFVYLTGEFGCPWWYFMIKGEIIHRAYADTNIRGEKAVRAAVHKDNNILQQAITNRKDNLL